MTKLQIPVIVTVNLNARNNSETKGSFGSLGSDVGTNQYGGDFHQSAQQTAHTPFHDMLPHLHTIHNDIILLNVLTEV